MDNKYSGSNFDDFLEEQGILKEVVAKAQKRFFILRIADMIVERFGKSFRRDLPNHATEN